MSAETRIRLAEPFRPCAKSVRHFNGVTTIHGATAEDFDEDPWMTVVPCMDAHVDNWGEGNWDNMETHCPWASQYKFANMSEFGDLIPLPDAVLGHKFLNHMRKALSCISRYFSRLECHNVRSSPQTWGGSRKQELVDCARRCSFLDQYPLRGPGISPRAVSYCCVRLTVSGSDFARVLCVAASNKSRKLVDAVVLVSRNEVVIEGSKFVPMRGPERVDGWPDLVIADNMSSSRGEGEPAATSGMGSGKNSTKRPSTTSRTWSDHARSKWFVDWCCADATNPVQQPCGSVIFVEANKRRRVLGAVLRWENAKGSRRRFYMKNVYGSKGNAVAGAKGAVLDMCLFEGFGAGAANTPFYNDLRQQGGFVLGRQFFDLLEDKGIALDVPCEVGPDLELSMPLQPCGGCESSGAAGEGGDLGSGEATHVQREDARGQFDDKEDEAIPRPPFSPSRERDRSVLSIPGVRQQTAADPGEEGVLCGSDLEPAEGHGAEGEAVGGEEVRGTPQKRKGQCQEELVGSSKKQKTKTPRTVGEKRKGRGVEEGHPDSKPPASKHKQPESGPSSPRPAIDVDAGYVMEYKDGVRTRWEFEISPAQIVDMREWEDLYNQRSLDPVLVETIREAMRSAFENKEQTYELPVFKLAPLGLQKPTPGTKAQRLKPEEWKDELVGEYFYYAVCGQHNAAAARSLLGSEVAKKLKSREVALAEGIVHIKWKDAGNVTSIAPFANDPLEADIRGAELKEAVTATKSHTFVLDLCEPVDLKLWKPQAWETLNSYLQTWCPSHWTLVVFVPRQHNLSFLASMHHLSFVKLLEGKWVRRVQQKKSFPVGNNLYTEEDRMYILFKGDDLRVNTSVVYEGNLPTGAAAAVRLPQRVTQTDVSEIPLMPCDWSLVAPERQGNVYGDMDRNPTQFVGLLDFLGKKGEGVVFLGKPHARSVWELLKAGRLVVAMEGNSDLLQFTMQVVKSEVNSSGHNYEFMVVRPTRDKDKCWLELTEDYYELDTSPSKGVVDWKAPPPSGPDGGSGGGSPGSRGDGGRDAGGGKGIPPMGERGSHGRNTTPGGSAGVAGFAVDRTPSTGTRPEHTTHSADPQTSSVGSARDTLAALVALGSRSARKPKSARIRTTLGEEPPERSGMRSCFGSGDPSTNREIRSIAARD
ncbi:hypothetical protein CBR_g19814 [Chara braunii]|uniref:Uncharacterized protein n=1 Tax=Chara braunii TaxID=69332 RepID=A0A388JU07_CHABU|nr:hypothetical protein CBR_g19814 [Chara braunii]|eukprot:GBG61281.1 hypothetical protein CBR_g19814 [Chara braunii]